MQQEITTAIAQAKICAKEQQELSPRCQQKLNNLRKSFPSFKDFAKKYNPQTQVKFAEDIRDTIMGDYSTLSTIDMALGKNTSAMWLTVAITDVNEYCGSKSMSDEQIKSLAYVLAQEYQNMKFSVMQLFFYRFKCGYFGKFFGKVDSMVISCSLKDFADECARKQGEYYHEEYLQRQAVEQRKQDEQYSHWLSFQRSLCKACQNEDGRKALARLDQHKYNEVIRITLRRV